jgi:hypothetical protein
LIYTHIQDYLFALGLCSVKHTQYILPLLTSTLTHPSSVSSPEVLVAAVRTMQSLIQNTWPRIGGYTGEVLKGVVGCWVRCQGVEGLEEVKEELRATVELLLSVLEESEREEVERTVRELRGDDDRVEGLFD